MKRVRRASNDNKLLAIGVAAVLLMFLIAYNWGSRPSVSSKTSLTKLETKIGKYREMLAKCNNDVKKKGPLESGEEYRLSEKHADLLSQEQELKKQEDDVIEEVASCEGESAELENAREHDSTITEEDVARMNEELEKTIALETDRNSTKGILLYETLKMLLLDHEALLRKIDPNAVIPKMDVQYQRDIVSKWAGVDAELKNGNFVEGESKIDTIEKYLATQERWAIPKRPHRLDAIDLDSEGKNVILLERTKQGNWPELQWKGFLTRLPRQGVISKPAIPVSHVHMQIRKMYNFLTCAMGTNVTTLMFPNEFRQCQTCPVELLSTFVQTPMLSFCTNCTTKIEETEEFKYLCGSNMVVDLYATEPFWRARSRLRYKDSILNTAEAYRKAKFIDPYEDEEPAYVIGIVLPDKPVQDAVPEKPTVMHTKVLKEANVPEVSPADVELQRQPTNKHIGETIKKRVAELTARGRTNIKLYVSARTWSPDDWVQLHRDPVIYALEQKVSPLYHYQNSDDATTKSDVIDTMVAAWCHEIIISRFDQKSLQVAENFMLTHRLNTSGIMVW